MTETPKHPDGGFDPFDAGPAQASGEESRKLQTLVAASATLVGQGGAGRLILPEALQKRIAAHESGHALVARSCGLPVDGTTIDPEIAGPNFFGRTWGPNSRDCKLLEQFSDIPLCELVRPHLPQPGEDLSIAAELYTTIYARTVELMAGTEAERQLFPDHAPMNAATDMLQATAHANLVATGPEAAAAFIDFAKKEAAARLSANRMALEMLAEELFARKTLTGVELDQIIADSIAPEALKLERKRRKEWAARVASADTFKNKIVSMQERT